MAHGEQLLRKGVPDSRAEGQDVIGLTLCHGKEIYSNEDDGALRFTVLVADICVALFLQLLDF